jgi:hypothetical protein
VTEAPAAEVGEGNRRTRLVHLMTIGP